MRKVVKGFIILCLFACQTLASELISLPRTISQDDQGFVWIGTQVSAIKHDGHQYWPVADDFGYINSIVHFEKDSYVAASLGVVKVSHTMQETPVFTTTKDNRVLDIKIIDDQLLVATQFNLFSVDLVTYEKKFLFTYLPATDIKMHNVDGKVCLQMNKAVSCIKENSPLEPIEINEVVHSSFMLNGDLLLVTSNSLLRIKDGKTQNLKTFDQKVTKAALSQKQDKIWLVIGEKLHLYDVITDEWHKHFYQRKSSSNVYNLFESSDGTVWLASTSLEKINEKQLASYPISNLDDTSGLGWLTSDFSERFFADVSGVYKLTDDKAEKLEVISAKTKGYIYSLLKDHSLTWLGGHYGLYLADLQRDYVKDYSDLVENSIVQCIRHISTDAIAVCTAENGVYKINTNSYTSEKWLSGSVFNNAADIVQTNKETSETWLATGEGVVRFKNGETTTFLESAHSIRLAWYQDTLYVATLDDGLYKLVINDDNVDVQPVLLPGLGDRIHDVFIKQKNLYVTTSLGAARIDLVTNLPKVWQLGEAVGRLSDTLGAITATGQRVQINKKLDASVFSGELRISSFKVSGHEQSLETEVSSVGLLEVSFSSTDYKFNQFHQYRIKINDHDWNKFTSVNHVSFVPKWGKNSIQVQSFNGHRLLEKEFSFNVHTPLYARSWAYVLYVVVFVTVAFAVKYRLKQYRNSLLGQNKAFSKAIQLVNKENAEREAQIKVEYQKRLKLVANEVLDRNERLVSALYERNSYKVAKEYQPLIDQIKKIEAFIITEHYDKAEKALGDLIIKLQIDANLSAPDILADGDNLADGIEKLVVSRQSSKPFLSFNTNIDKAKITVDDRLEPIAKYIYKAISELIEHLINELMITHIEINVTHKHNSLSVCLNVEHLQINESAFSQKNLGLYQVKLLLKKLNSKIELHEYLGDGSSLSFIIPLANTAEKPKSNTSFRTQ